MSCATFEHMIPEHLAQQRQQDYEPEQARSQHGYADGVCYYSVHPCFQWNEPGTSHFKRCTIGPKKKHSPGSSTANRQSYGLCGKRHLEQTFTLARQENNTQKITAGEVQKSL